MNKQLVLSHRVDMFCGGDYHQYLENQMTHEPCGRPEPEMNSAQTHIRCHRCWFGVGLVQYETNGVTVMWWRHDRNTYIGEVGIA